MSFSPNSLGGGKPIVVKGRYASYELQGVLGKGGSAVVYKAMDLATMQVVAAKKITALDDDAMHQWRTEVETLMTLKDVDGSHHVIRYLDHLVHEKTIVIVEEFAANGSLQAHLRQNGGGFDERDVARLVHQVTSGLAFIHSKGIVHRDLKCANALVCEDGQVKLSDFGLSAIDPKQLAEEAAKAARMKDATAAAESHEDAAHPVMGSVYWMAPETVLGQDANPSSDIWSLGCLCIELLTGQPPFFDRPPASALYRIVECKEPVPLPDVPLSEAGRAFIQACLNPDPAQRPTAARLLQSPWFADVRVQLRLDMIVARAAQQEVEEAGAGRQTRAEVSAAGASTSLSSTAAAAAAAAAATGEATDSVAQWVEANLFSDVPARSAAWAKESLPKLVLALPFLTPAEAHDAIRLFAFAAERMAAAFANPLGASTFWDYPGLNLTDDTPLHAAMIFEACCQHQSPRVCAFAPSCPRAITFLLSSRRGDAAPRCVEALHQLYCPSGEPSDSLAQAQSRLVADGGLLALRTYLEAACQTAFEKDEPPALGWVLVDKLFGVVLAALDTDGAEELVWGGRPAPAAADDPSAQGGVPAAETDERDTLPHSTPQESALGQSTTITASPAASPTPRTCSTLQPSVRWYLAIQEASRSTVAPCAAELLLKLVHHLAQSLQQAGKTPPPQSPRSQQPPSTKADLFSSEEDTIHTQAPAAAPPPAAAAAADTSNYLERAGVSLAGILLQLVCCSTLPDGLRIRAVQSIPVLQSCSQHGAEYLADAYGTIPLYAHLLLRAPAATTMDGLREVLLMLLGLCDGDPRVVSGCARSSLLPHALGLVMCPPDAARGADLSLCVRLVLLLRGTTPTADSVAGRAIAEQLAQVRGEAEQRLRAYAADPATPPEQVQLCAELLDMAMVGGSSMALASGGGGGVAEGHEGVSAASAVAAAGG